MQYPPYNLHYIQAAAHFARAIGDIAPPDSPEGQAVEREIPGDKQHHRNLTSEEVQRLAELMHYVGNREFNKILHSAKKLSQLCEQATALYESDDMRRKVKAQLGVSVQIGNVVEDIREFQQRLASMNLPYSDELNVSDRALNTIMHQHQMLRKDTSGKLKESANTAFNPLKKHRWNIRAAHLDEFPCTAKARLFLDRLNEQAQPYAQPRDRDR